MKVTMKRDVLLPALGNGHQLGSTGQVVDMPDHHAKEYIKLGHAEAAPSDAEVTVHVKPAERETKPLTKESLKQPAGDKPGPTETK